MGQSLMLRKEWGGPVLAADNLLLCDGDGQDGDGDGQDGDGHVHESCGAYKCFTGQVEITIKSRCCPIIY